MTDFDNRFADRVREAFDAYEEPVDEAAWARTQAALASGADSNAAPVVASGARRAEDRAPVASGVSRRHGIWAGATALAALVLAAGVWLARPTLSPEAEMPAVATATPPSRDNAETAAEPDRAAEADGLAAPAASGEDVCPWLGSRQRREQPQVGDRSDALRKASGAAPRRATAWRATACRATATARACS